MRISLLLILITSNILALESEVQESARRKSLQYQQFITAMKELERVDDLSELLQRRQFQVPRLRVIVQFEDEEWMMLRKEDFD